MNSKANHGRDFDAQILGASQHETALERLKAAYSALSTALGKLKYPLAGIGAREGASEDIILADLNLTTAGYESLISIVRDVLRQSSRKQAQKFLDEYHLVTLVALVGHALTSVDASFWDSLKVRLGIEDEGWFPSFIRENLLSWLSRRSLTTFAKVDFGGADYVSKIFLHSGISARDVVDLYEYIRSIDQQGIAFPSGEEFAKYACQRDDDEWPEQLEHLILALPKRATGIFGCVYDLYTFARTEENWEDELEEGFTAGLPEPTYATVIELLAGRELQTFEETDESIGGDEPYIELDIDNAIVMCVFPPVPVGSRTADVSYERSVTIDSDRLTVTQHRDYATSFFVETQIPIQRPVTHVALDSGGTIPVIPTDRPFLFFGVDGNVRRDQRNLRGSETIVLAPSTITVNGAAAITQSADVQGWDSWKIFSLDLSSGEFTITADGSSYTIVVNRSSHVRWNLDDIGLRHVLGPNHRPVATRIPAIAVPNDGATWSYQAELLTQEEPENLGEYEIPADGEFYDLLDPGTDPWIGRFLFTIFRDGKIQEKKEVHIAEGLEATLSYKSRPDLKFRVLHNTSGSFDNVKLTGVFVQFSADRFKGLLEVPRDNNSIDGDEGPRQFTVKNRKYPEYSLPVTVLAPTMSFQIPLESEMNKWHRDFVTLDSSDIDSYGTIRLRFPERVQKSPELVITSIDDRGGRGSLLKRLVLTSHNNGKEWYITGDRLVNMLDDDGDYIISAMWTELTPAQKYKRDHPTRNLKKVDLSKVTVPRCHAVLAKLTRKPLLQSAKLYGNQVKLTLGRDVSRKLDVRVWSLFNPTADPVHLVVEGTEFTLPEETFTPNYPIIVEVEEQMHALSMFGATRNQEKAPSSKARVADPNEHNVYTGAKIPDKWMFLPAERPLLRGELQKVWHARARLSRVSDRNSHNLVDFHRASGIHLRTNPRESLDVLHTTSLEAHQQIAMLIATGLLLEDFSTNNTDGDLHTVPWVGLIEELNDLWTLSKSDSEGTNGEYADSLSYIGRYGGPMLLSYLSGNKNASTWIQKTVDHIAAGPQHPNDQIQTFTQELSAAGIEQPLISVPTRLAGYVELLKSRNSITKIDHIRDMSDFLYEKEGLVFKHGDTSIRDAVSTLRRKAEKSGTLWAHIPYISFVFTALARLQAHDLLRIIPNLELYLPELAAISSMVPTMVTSDLVFAEALAINKAESQKG